MECYKDKEERDHHMDVCTGAKGGLAQILQTAPPGSKMMFRNVNKKYRRPLIGVSTMYKVAV